LVLKRSCCNVRFDQVELITIPTVGISPAETKRTLVDFEEFELSRSPKTSRQSSGVTMIKSPEASRRNTSSEDRFLSTSFGEGADVVPENPRRKVTRSYSLDRMAANAPPMQPLKVPRRATK
jgi:hypothetical protein